MPQLNVGRHLLVLSYDSQEWSARGSPSSTGSHLILHGLDSTAGAEHGCDTYDLYPIQAIHFRTHVAQKCWQPRAQGSCATISISCLANHTVG
jgi:hypothetical protein